MLNRKYEKYNSIEEDISQKGKWNRQKAFINLIKGTRTLQNMQENIDRLTKLKEKLEADIIEKEPLAKKCKRRISKLKSRNTKKEKELEARQKNIEQRSKQIEEMQLKITEAEKKCCKENWELGSRFEKDWWNILIWAESDKRDQLFDWYGISIYRKKWAYECQKSVWHSQVALYKA